jgi:hypothetical protein
MPDSLELFADLVDAPAPRDGFAERPIGRRRNPRPSPTRRGASSRVVEALHRVERALEAHSVVTLDLAATAERLASDLTTAARERREIRERLNQLLRAQTETRRALGQTDLHIPVRHSRRRPLG